MVNELYWLMVHSSSMGRAQKMLSDCVVSRNRLVKNSITKCLSSWEDNKKPLRRSWSLKVRLMTSSGSPPSCWRHRRIHVRRRRHYRSLLSPSDTSWRANNIRSAAVIIVAERELSSRRFSGWWCWCWVVISPPDPRRTGLETLWMREHENEEVFLSGDSNVLVLPSIDPRLTGLCTFCFREEKALSLSSSGVGFSSIVKVVIRVSGDDPRRVGFFTFSKSEPLADIVDKSLLLYRLGDPLWWWSFLVGRSLPTRTPASRGSLSQRQVVVGIPVPVRTFDSLIVRTSPPLLPPLNFLFMLWTGLKGAECVLWNLPLRSALLRGLGACDFAWSGMITPAAAAICLSCINSWR
jgi:hypothetical protein